MTTHWNLSDDDFLALIQSGQLSPALFTHEAHLRLAWLQLEREDLTVAKEKVSTLILDYVDRLGARDKYHHTLTVAAVQIVDHFRQRTNTKDFAGLLESFPRLLDDFKGLVETHYSKGHYQTAVARTQYVAPDLLPF